MSEHFHTMVHIFVIIRLVIFLAVVIPLIPSLALDMMGQILIARQMMLMDGYTMVPY
ncbi:MAG: hypothetical protein ACFFE3_12035 [Candidatus Thorarchaeota archaeon]